MKFLFWNIHNNGANIERAVEYGRRHCVDVLAFCEVPCDALSEIQTEGYNAVQHIDAPNGIEVLIRSGIDGFYARERKRYCIIHIGEKAGINAVVAHLNSDLHSSGREYRGASIETIKEDLEIEESKYENKNSLVMGDLNVNLFDDQITGWLGFNASLFRCAAAKGQRKKHERSQDIFYNPMLQVYKDAESESEAKGTWHDKATNEWYCFDQVLMKSPLMNGFDVTRLKILSELDGEALVERHRPKADISDHMPIYFELISQED